MTKTTSALAGVLVALFVLATFGLTVSAYADTRDSRDRGETGRTIDLTPPPSSPSPNPDPAPTPPPPPPSGGITSSTNGVADTGGNTGGDVTTGDESVEVHEVNVGPTNPPPPPQEEEPVVVTPPPPSEPEPTCDPRTRIGCEPEGARNR